MDCRKHMFWSLALMSILTGCTTTGSNTTPAPIINPNQLSQIDPKDIKKDSDLPKRPPTAKICTVWANGATDEAARSGDSPVKANELRDQARKAYQQAIQIDAKYMDAYLGLAHLYVAMEDYEHAVATLGDASKALPDKAIVWFELGKIYSSRKEWEPTLEYFGRAAQLEPENRMYVDTLGHAQARAGKTKEALQTYMRVMPEAKAYYNVARMMQHLNQPEACRQYLQAALQKDPQLPGAEQMLAELNGGNPPGVMQAGSPPVQAGTVDPIPNN